MKARSSRRRSWGRDRAPEDESRERGSIAATGGDGEGRELAIAERLLLRRLGWESVGLLCEIREQHGPPGCPQKPQNL